MKKQLHNFIRLTIVLSVAVVLTGCGKTVLYSNLQEKEVNEMMAILLSRGIDVEKIAAKENLWNIDVAQSDMARSVDILNTYGYPTDDFESLGQIFQKSGLVSSPSEERIRFMYALSQGVAETLSNIDGVLTARVHVVLQNNDPLSDIKTPSSAAVFIKYRRGSGVETLGSQIKRLVANSIEGLNYDKISLIFFPADINQGIVMTPSELEKASSTFDMRFWLILSLGILLLLILLGVGGSYWYFQGRKTSSTNKASPGGTENR